MVTSCSCPGCTNRHVKGRSLHRFPKDEELKKKWLLAIKRPDYKPGVHSRICEDHFNPEDYLINYGRRKLRPGIVPSIFIFDRSMRKAKRKSRLKILDRSADTNIKENDNLSTNLTLGPSPCADTLKIQEMSFQTSILTEDGLLAFNQGDPLAFKQEDLLTNVVCTRTTSSIPCIDNVKTEDNNPLTFNHNDSLTNGVCKSTNNEENYNFSTIDPTFRIDECINNMKIQECSIQTPISTVNDPLAFNHNDPLTTGVCTSSSDWRMQVENDINIASALTTVKLLQDAATQTEEELRNLTGNKKRRKAPFKKNRKAPIYFGNISNNNLSNLSLTIKMWRMSRRTIDRQRKIIAFTRNRNQRLLSKLNALQGIENHMQTGNKINTDTVDLLKRCQNPKANN